MVMEMLQTVDKGFCENCHGAITQTIGEWSPKSWHHDDTGLKTCPGSPVATPATQCFAVLDDDETVLRCKESPGHDDDLPHRNGGVTW